MSKVTRDRRRIGCVRRAKTTTMMGWLRDHFFPDVYGEEYMVEGRRETRPSYPKQVYLHKKNNRGWLRKLANYRLRDHLDSKATYYYMGDPDAPTTLVMIDIDVGKKGGRGTTEGAWAFAAHLKTFWQNLYFEPSTGGKGVHGYLVVEKEGHDAEAVNAYLKSLQGWLRAEAEVTNADIELVEVKGTLPVITRRYGQVAAIRYGQFAKVPRTEHRFEELKNTTVLKMNSPLPQHSAEAQAVTPTKSSKGVPSSSGSISGKNISDEELALIPEFERLYEALALHLRHERYVVTAHDFAVFCVLLRHFTQNPNADGTLPVRRVEKLWQALFHAGDVDRPFNHHRFKVLRDFLSQNKHLLWVDHRYQRPDGDKDGIACKWRLTDHFFGLLDLAAEQGGTSFVVIQEFQNGTGEHKTPTMCLIRAEKEQKWWKWAFEQLENNEFYSLAA